MADPRVEAIRSNEKIGRGSCSSIDECYEDEELISELDEDEIKTPKAAVKWALEKEGLWLEKGLNQRWGDDDDPQLKAYNQFHDNSLDHLIYDENSPRPNQE